MSPTGLGRVLTKKQWKTQRKAANPHILEKGNCECLAHFYHKSLNWRSKLLKTFQFSWLSLTCHATVNPTRLVLLANRNKRSTEICFTSDSVLISKTDVNVITTTTLCLSDSSSVLFQHIYSTKDIFSAELVVDTTSWYLLYIEDQWANILIHPPCIVSDTQTA